jgi:hypothetical protein
LFISGALEIKTPLSNELSEAIKTWEGKRTENPTQPWRNVKDKDEEGRKDSKLKRQSAEQLMRQQSAKPPTPRCCACRARIIEERSLGDSQKWYAF